MREYLSFGKINVVKILFILIYCGINEHIYSQQLPLYSQYNFNDFIYNPAYSGYNKDYAELTFSHRKQWSGVYGSPHTTMITYNSSKSKDNNIGYSGYGYYDKSGYIYTMSMYGNYSYNVMVTDDIRLGAGLGLGLNLMGLDAGIYNKYTQNDFILQENIGITPRISLDMGIFVSYIGFDLGFSVPNIVSGLISSSDQEDRIYTIKRVYVPSLRYTLPLNMPFLGSFNGDVLLKPLFLIRLLEGTPQSYELHTMLDIKKLGWINIGYKGGIGSVKPVLEDSFYIGENDLFFGLGYNLTSNVSLGYTFGSGMTKTLRNQGLNHEFVLLYRLQNTQDLKKQIEKEFADKEKERIEYMDAIEKKLKADQDSLEKKLKKDIIINQNDINDLRENIKNNGGQDGFNVSQGYVPPRNLDNVKTPQENTYIVDDPSTMPNNVVAGSRGYYIVVGAFKFRENAEKRGKELGVKGIQNSVFYSEDNQMYYVFLRKYTDYDTAVKMRGNNLNGKYKKEEFEGDQLWIKEIR